MKGKSTMDKEYEAVELTDEELAKVVGGRLDLPCNFEKECGTCTLASAQYLACPVQQSGSSGCKHNQ